MLKQILCPLNLEKLEMIETGIALETAGLIKRSFDTSFNQTWRHRFLNQSLQQVNSPQAALTFFSRYIAFNSVFAGGVARLAGAVHVSQSIFMGQGLSMNRNIYSKSSEIASNIFAAAEDEFNAMKQQIRVTHRDMAGFFLEATVDFFNSSDLYIPQVDTRLESLLDEVMTGYCITGIPADAALLEGIGFHIASEELADQEFITIRDYLLEKYPEPGLLS
ncbi:MAG: hypothetical protein QM764_20625 [Chitinophagaceae bacterium]